MHSVVRSFRTNIVEGRFIPFVASFGVILMRIALYLRVGTPEILQTDGNYLWDPLAPVFGNPLVSFIASTISVFFISWILTHMNSRYNLIRARSNLPFVAPLFLFSLHPYFLAMSGDYISIIFILFAFFPLLESYQKPDSYLYSFRSAILIAIASLFQIYALMVIPLWWNGEKTMRGPQLRSFIASVFGLMLVYVSIFSLFYLFDDINGFLQPILSFTSFSIPLLPEYSIIGWATVAFVGLFYIINMTFSVKIYGRDKVLSLNLMQFFLFLIILLLLLQVVYWSKTLFFFMLSLTFISYLNSYINTLTNTKNHIYLAYVMLIFMFLIYLFQLIPELLPSL